MTQNNTMMFSRGDTGEPGRGIFRSLRFLKQTNTKRLSFLFIPFFFSFFLFSGEAYASCYVSLPNLTTNNGCAQASYAPYASSGTVEYMWAKNNNGSISPVTGWSTNTPLTYCPSSSGYYRLCARKVGCSTIYESPDVYVNPGGGNGNGNCYKIKTKGCNKILDIENGSNNSGAKLIQWSGNDQLNQRFSFDHLGNGVYRIIAVHSGKVLEAKNGGTGNGTHVVQGNWTGASKQKWSLYSAGSGYYFIKNKKSGKYMDHYGNCGNGEKIELWSYYGDKYQKFKLIEKSDCGNTECDGEITSVKINALSGGSDIVLSNNAVYNVSELPANWNLEAMVNGTVESVKFTITGDEDDMHTENFEPYRYPTDEVSANFGPGTYTINVKAFRENHASGELCDEKTITITITDVCTGDITALVLDDLGGGQDVPITEGAIFTPDQLPASFRLQALVAGDHESLGWVISGDLNDTGTENFEPYTFPGGSTSALTLGVGTYTVHATLYSGANLSGEACDEVSVSFSIVEENICIEAFPGGGIGLGVGGVLSSDEVCNSCSDTYNDPVIIVSTSAPDAGGDAIEVVWIKKTGSSIADCGTDDLADINVGAAYDAFLAAGGFGVADPQIGTTGWMFVSDFDSDDLSLTLDCVEEATCFRRCARRVDCDRFQGESNAVFIDVNEVEGGTIGLLAYGAPVLDSDVYCQGSDVPVIANGVSPSAPGGVEIVWLRTHADGGLPTDKVAALAAVNVGQLYNNYLAGGSTSPYVFIPGSDVVWEFVSDGDSNDEELAMPYLDKSYHFMRCVRAIGDVRFCGESVPMPVTIYVEDCTAALSNPCSWSRCDGTVTINGANISGVNSIKVLDGDDAQLSEVFACGTYLDMQCTDPIEVTLPNPDGNYILAIICDNGNHYDYIRNDCSVNPLVGLDEADQLGTSRAQAVEEGNEAAIDRDRSRNVVMSENLREFEIFPNPASREVFVGLNKFAGRSSRISILNALGQVMQTLDVDALPEGKIRLDISNLVTGVYFVRMEVEGEKELTKRLLVKQSK